MPTMTAMLRLLSLLTLLFLVTGCGSGTAAGHEPSAERLERSKDPRLLEARAALAAGRPASAASLLEGLGQAAGVEGPLCLSRVYLVENRVVEALAQLELARSMAPDDLRVVATSAELLALVDRGAEADDALRRGAELNPDSPDLARARALLELTRPGQGPVALARLEAALAADPELPYCDWPLAQAHLLSGRAALSGGDGEAAVEEARAALELEPGLATAEELLGLALSAQDNFVDGIAALERARDLGLDVDADLADVNQRAGLAARLLNLDEAAEDYYMAARELGLSDEELSSGADFLRERAREAFARGQAAAMRDAHAEAAEAYARCLALDPEGALALDAQDGLAGARFRMQDYLGAALAWREVQAAERAAGTGATSMTHLNLARARFLAGDPEGAREVLLEDLEAYPEAAGAAETRALLAKLPED